MRSSIIFLWKTWTVRISVIAALFYSSWPLGYLLDPAVEKNALASELQALHRPYNWVFIMSDVVAGVLCLGIGLWQLYRRPNGYIKLAIFGLIGFGSLVAIAALTPLSCEPGTPQCGEILRNYRLVAHGFASIVSVCLLFMGLVTASLYMYKIDLVDRVRHLVRYLVGGWIIFAAGSILEIIFHIHGNLLQYYFITVCSLSIVATVAITELYMQRSHL